MSASINAARPVNVLAVGPFGRAVARYLSTFLAPIVETVLVQEQLPAEEDFSRARVHVVAAWRPVPLLCELLDQFIHREPRPFIPLILESAMLRLGPVIVPGSGSCWNCWMKRSSQHAQWPKDQATVLQHYSAHPEAGPKGYLEPFALLGALRIKQTIEALDSATAVPGSIWEIDTITRRTASSVVVGIHDCPRCGLHRYAPTRSVAEMQEQLTYLLSDQPAERPTGKESDTET
jgi:bacteriocin biosynthesis cyclodehydratase domain-containing protein